MDVVSLDPRRVERIIGFRMAADLRALYRRQANARNFSTAIVGSASQALSWADPACRVLELQPVYVHAQHEIADKPISHTDRVVNQPEGAGHGAG